MAKSSMISSDNFDEFNTQLQGAALKATRNALAIPSDVNFHRSVDPQVARDMDRISSRVLSLTNDILAFVSAADSAKLIRNQGKSKLNDLTDAVDNFTSIVVDPVDLLFERAVSHTNSPWISIPDKKISIPGHLSGRVSWKKKAASNWHQREKSAWGETESKSNTNAFTNNLSQLNLSAETEWTSRMVRSSVEARLTFTKAAVVFQEEAGQHLWSAVVPSNFAQV
jgi:PMC2NT (NUC016) domain